MAKKNESSDYLRGLMKEADIYDARYEAQIEDAADTRDMIASARKMLGKRYIDNEMKTGGLDTKMVVNPLLDVITKLKKVYQSQLGALGLNFDSFKKADNKSADKKDTSMLDYLARVNEDQ